MIISDFVYLEIALSVFVYQNVICTPICLILKLFYYRLMLRHSPALISFNSIEKVKLKAQFIWCLSLPQFSLSQAIGIANINYYKLVQSMQN